VGPSLINIKLITSGTISLVGVRLLLINQMLINSIMHAGFRLLTISDKYCNPCCNVAMAVFDRGGNISIWGIFMYFT